MKIEDYFFKSNLSIGNAGNVVSDVTLRYDGQENYDLSENSIFFDSPSSAFKSTQQLNIDFSKFENHTFFNSAQNKVQVSIEKIINQFPFDGTRTENQEFISKLSGFEKYVFDIYPKNVGFLNFDRNGASVGNYLIVKDNKQSSSVEVNLKSGDGKPVIDFKNNPFTCEFYLYVPNGSSNDNQIIVQKLNNNNNGFTIALSSSINKTDPNSYADLNFIVSSGSLYVTNSLEIQKGIFQHICCVYDLFGSNQLLMYKNGVKSDNSSNLFTFGDIDFSSSPIYIGTGTYHNLDTEVFTPVTTLSGSLDELRIFNESRSQEKILKYYNKSIYSEPNLKLYFKFNEPSGSFYNNGSFGNQDLVIDYSGNGLHTKITNFSINQRNTGSILTQFTAEDKTTSPVLFPSHEYVRNLTTILLSSASDYDYNNPNLITRLVPKHYLLEASDFEGFYEENGNIEENPSYQYDFPGGNKMSQAQIISSILFMWAEQFDEIKMFVDEFGRLLKIDYKNKSTISDKMLLFLAKYYGFNLPSFESFTNSNIPQFKFGEDLSEDYKEVELSLQKIQNTIWRRILSDLKEIVSSKGTRHSINTVLKNIGIYPDSIFKIVEYGSAKTNDIGDSYIEKSENGRMLDFSGSIDHTNDSINLIGESSYSPLIKSLYLSSSRIEPGIPGLAGSFVDGKSNNKNDGLLLSGSWTFENTYKFENYLEHPVTQSLFRLHSTGTYGNSSNNWLQYNLIGRSQIISSNITGSLTLFGRPSSSSGASTLELTLTGVNIFDGDKWLVTFGRDRNDRIGSQSKSLYFLRAGKLTSGYLNNYFSTSSYFDDSGTTSLNTISTDGNSSGSFCMVGSMSLGYDNSSTRYHLNRTSNIEHQYTKFSGKIANMRFFTKFLSEDETKTHINNFKSVGVSDPLLNYNFNTVSSGSFERLRYDVSIIQPTITSNSSGQINLFDFSQNNFSFSGNGFESNKEVIKVENYIFRMLNPKFETFSNNNRIRINSFSNAENVEKFNSNFAPQYNLKNDQDFSPDNRVSVESSLIDALNEDIINIFSTLNILDNFLGNPELLYSPEYSNLRRLREIYFNRLENKISFKKFFEFFNWFDSTIGDIFSDLIPKNSKFIGSNLVIESHMLERPKFVYSNFNTYLDENLRITDGAEEINFNK